MGGVQKNIDYKIKGYYNKWSVIDIYKGYALMENNTYGDETCYLVVKVKDNVQNKEYTKKSNGEKIMLPTIMEVVCETYDGIEIALEDEGII